MNILTRTSNHVSYGTVRRRRTAALAVLALTAMPITAAQAATTAPSPGAPADVRTNSGAIVTRSHWSPSATPDASPAFSPISSPSQYPSGTCTVDLSAFNDFDPVPSVDQCGQHITFTPVEEKRSVPGSWATWGSPPDTESATPDILFSGGATSVTITLSQPVDVAGVEAEPDPFEVHTFQAEFDNSGGGTIGTVTRDIDGNAGATVLAAQAPGTRTLTISSDVDFSFGALRLGQSVSGFSAFKKPNNKYLKGMCLADPSGLGEYAEVTEVDMPGEKCLIHSVSFSKPEGPDGVDNAATLQVLHVPTSWPSWAPPPYTETATPWVLYTQGATSVKMTFGADGQYAGTNCKGGVEVQPSGTQTHKYQGDFRDVAGNLLGSVFVSANGNGGARLLGADTTGDPRIKTITVTDISTTVTPTDFAMAQLHDCAGGGSKGGIKPIKANSKPHGMDNYHATTCSATFEPPYEYDVITSLALTQPNPQCQQHDVSFWQIAGTPQPMKVLRVPSSWPAWGGPGTESTTPWVLSTQGASSVLITYGVPGVLAGSRTIAGAEIQPATGGTHLYMGEFRDYLGNLLGTVYVYATAPTANILAGAASGNTIKTLRITDITGATSSGFALAQLRSSIA